MKRVIRSNSTQIYGMATKLKHARNSVGFFSTEIRNNLLKCVIYGNSTNDYHHWLDIELSTWLRDIANTTTTTRTTKLKYSEYEDKVFVEIGNTINDARIIIDKFYYDKVDKTHEYPEFDLDDRDLWKRTANMLNRVVPTFCKLFADKSSADIEKEDIAKILHSIMDKYCL